MASPGRCRRGTTTEAASAIAGVAGTAATGPPTLSIRCQAGAHRARRFTSVAAIVGSRFGRHAGGHVGGDRCHDGTDHHRRDHPPNDHRGADDPDHRASDHRATEHVPGPDSTSGDEGRIPHRHREDPRHVGAVPNHGHRRRGDGPAAGGRRIHLRQGAQSHPRREGAEVGDRRSGSDGRPERRLRRRDRDPAAAAHPDPAAAAGGRGCGGRHRDLRATADASRARGDRPSPSRTRPTTPSLPTSWTQIPASPRRDQRACSASISLGRTLCTSPTMPRSAIAEDRRLLVLVDRDDVLRALHAHHVLRGAGDAGGDVDGGLDDLAGLADLVAVGHPTGVDDAHGTRPAHP